MGIYGNLYISVLNANKKL